MNSVERVKSLCKERKIPISKLEKDLGYSNGYVGKLQKGVFPADRLASIAKYLNVSNEYLLNGNESRKPVLTKKDEKCIEKILDATKEQLLSQDGLMFESGQPATPEAIDSIISAMQIGMEMAKKKNNEKYTPKSIRRTDDL